MRNRSWYYFPEICLCSKSSPKVIQLNWGDFVDNHATPYTISNPPVWAIMRSKGFRIYPHLAEKRGTLLLQATFGHTVHVWSNKTQNSRTSLRMNQLRWKDGRMRPEGVLHTWRPSNFAANLASLHILVSSQCPIFHQRGRGRRLRRTPFTWSRFTCGGLAPSCPMSGYPQAMSAMSAGPGPTCRASLAPKEPYIYQMHRYCRPRIFEFRCQTRPKFYFKARRARKMMEKSA